MLICSTALQRKLILRTRLASDLCEPAPTFCSKCHIQSRCKCIIVRLSCDTKNVGLSCRRETERLRLAVMITRLCNVLFHKWLFFVETSMYSHIKMNFSLASDSPIILVFPVLNIFQNPDGVTPTER